MRRSLRVCSKADIDEEHHIDKVKFWENKARCHSFSLIFILLFCIVSKNPSSWELLFERSR